MRAVITDKDVAAVILAALMPATARAPPAAEDAVVTDPEVARRIRDAILTDARAPPSRAASVISGHGLRVLHSRVRSARLAALARAGPGC